jgi:DNA-binding NarL/FixJ family response regulator
MPLEAAQMRLEIARAMVTRDAEIAATEARTALAAFEQLGAARDADAAAALLREVGVRPKPGPKGHRPLTKRESEVLQLVGLGLSNPEIANRLYVSRKTVESHVSSILAKLGLRGRGEAVAYALRRDEGNPTHK